MNEKRRQIVDDATLRDTLAEIVLETSKEELIEALGEAEFEAEAKRGRELIDRVLRESGVVPLPMSSDLEFHHGLGAMLKLLKRREGLSSAELSARAEIDEEELRRIELDPSFEPSPRAIYRLERFFGLPSRSIAILAGAVKVEDETSFRREVVQFAAKSASMGKLTKEEKRHLSQFVKLLGQFTKRT